MTSGADKYDIAAVMRAVEAASSAPQALAACRDAAELIRSACRAHQDQPGAAYGSFALAAAHAVSAREALSSAPSLGEGPLKAAAVPDGADPDDVAGQLAVLAGLVRVRLLSIELLNAVPADVTACQRAAREAEQVVVLLAKEE